MRNLRQSTAYNLLVFMTDSSDHIAGKTGLTLTITASKDGAAFASITPTVTERGNGWYNLDLTTSHTDTLGDLGIHVTGTGADPSDLICQVQAFISTVVTNIDATISSRSAPGTAQTITAPADMALNSTVAKEATLTTKIPTALSFTGSNVNAESKITAAPSDMALNSTVAKDATVSKPGTAQTISSNADITAIKAKTDNLPADPADQSAVEAAIAGIPAAPSAATNAAAVRTEIGTELARIDAAVSTRSAPGTAQTISDNASITAIKAKTDNLPSDPADASDISTAFAAIPAAIGGRTVPKTSGKTYDQVMEMSAALVGAKLTGMVSGTAGTTTLRTLDDSQDLIVATQDANGNRSAVTVTP
jgi:hypothetical protein